MFSQWLQDDFPLWPVFIAPVLGLATVGLISLWKLIEPSFHRPQQYAKPVRHPPSTDSSAGPPKSTVSCPPPPQPDVRLPGPVVGRPRHMAPSAGKPPRSNHRKRRENRVALRRGGNPLPVMISGDDSVEPVSGSVIDRSRGGMSLLAASAFPAGAVVRVRSMQYADVAPWVEVEVKHCRAVEGNWVLGCKFTQTQPWSVLLLFG